MSLSIYHDPRCWIHFDSVLQQKLVGSLLVGNCRDDVMTSKPACRNIGILVPVLVHSWGMRRRLLRWQPSDNDDCQSNDYLSSKSQRKFRNKLLTLTTVTHRTKLAALILVFCAGVLLIHRIVRIIRRYTKENDPYYKAFRFGNASAVTELYEALNVTMLPLNPRRPVVFYNVYIPSERNEVFAIVKEQLHQIALISEAYQGGKHIITVNLVTIGEDDSKSTTVLEACNSLAGLKCRLVKHYESADEEVTLQALYDHCQEHPSTTVTYLHTKGSFHYSQTNNAWRRALTAAALHPDCWSHDICSVCGLQFFTQFTLFWPGNMWTARCGYVNQLIPPLFFQSRLENTVAKMLRLRLEGIFTSYLLRDRKDYFGLDRYHAEHWIGSHPDLQPCDMESLERPQQVFKRRSSVQDIVKGLQFSLAPRLPGFAVGHNFEAHRMLQQNKDERRKEIYLLPGKLFLWYELYQRVPSSRSWVWKWFPDGAFWKAKVDQFGSNVIGMSTLEELFHRMVEPRRPNNNFTSKEDGTIVFHYFRENMDNNKRQLQHLRERTNKELVVFLLHKSRNDDLSAQELLSFCQSLWVECHPLTHWNNITSLWDIATEMVVSCEGSDSSRHAKALEGFRRCQGSGLMTCEHGFQRLVNKGTGIVCVDEDCHQVSAQNFYVGCWSIVHLPSPPLFLKMVKVALQGVQLADVRAEIRWKPDLQDAASIISEFLFDSWISMHPSTHYCSGDIPIASHDRTLLLVVLLVSEVYSKHHALQRSFCHQRWEKLLQLPSVFTASEYIAEKDLQSLYHVMEGHSS